MDRPKEESVCQLVKVDKGMDWVGQNAEGGSLH